MSGWLRIGQVVKFKLGNLSGQIVEAIIPDFMFTQCTDGQIWITGYSSHIQLEGLVKFNLRLPDGNLIRELNYNEIDWLDTPYFIEDEHLD